MKKTPLNQVHHDAGAVMIDFGGWEMPVSYTGIGEEHTATRTKAGLFDLCHMGRVKVTGADRKAFLDHICTNRISDMAMGQARYSLLCNENGTIIDDVIVYVQEPWDLIVINAGNRDKDIAHFQEQAKNFDVTVDDWSDRWCMISIQGPNSQDITQPLTPVDLDTIKYYYGAIGQFMGLDAFIARTGYTGEDGFEVYFDANHSVGAWSKFMAAGQDKGLVAVGLGARDTLRLEAGMPLYGHEIDDTTNPLEAGLGWAVKLDKETFIGRDALAAVKEAGLTRKLVGWQSDGKRIPRQGAEVLNAGAVVGSVCSGAPSPTLGATVGTAYVPAELSKIDTELEVSLGRKTQPLRVIKKPFYKRGS